MARSHWIAFGACPAVLAFIVAACGGSSDPEETNNGTDSGTIDSGPIAVVDSGSPVDAGDPGTGDASALPPEDPNAIGTTDVSSLNFGTVDCETQAPAKTFSLNNTSTTGTMSFIAALGLDTGSPFTVSPSQGKIGPGKRQIITVTPNAIPRGTRTQPTSTGANAQGDSLTISTGTTGTSSLEVDLLQTARGAVLTFAPNTIDFRNASTLAPNAVTAQFAVQNSGNVDTPVTLTLDNGNVFGLDTVGTTTANATAVAGFQTPSTVVFKPASATSYSGNVSVALRGATPLCADLPASPVTLAGAGVASTVALDSSALNFGVTNCGSTAGSLTATLTNLGSLSTKIVSIGVTTGASFYGVATSKAVNAVITSGDTSTITVTPRAISATAGSVATNAYYGQITILTQDTNNVQTSLLLDLNQSARGVILTRSGNAAFGSIGRGNVGKQKVTYSNAGNVDANVTITHNTVLFGVPATLSIPKAAAVGQPGTTDANYTFTPDIAASGSPVSSDTVTFTSSDAAPFCTAITAATTSLGGTGIAPVTTVLPGGTQTFGPVNCGSTPGTKVLTYTNNGPAIAWTAAFVTGTQYTVSPAAGNLAAGASVDLTITANAVGTNLTSINTISDNLIFTPGNGENNVTSAIQVVPTGPFIQWVNTTNNGAISAYGFGTQTRNATYPSTIGLKNIGNAAATFTFALAAGSNAAFAQSVTTTGGDIATQGLFSPLGTTFTPAVTAGVTGTLVATSTTIPACNRDVTSAQLALSGTGK